METHFFLMGNLVTIVISSINWDLEVPISVITIEMVYRNNLISAYI